MKPRHRADRRTLLWAYGLFPLVTLAPYACPRLLPWTVLPSLYVGLCAAAMAHNHNHAPVFWSRRANALHAAWISVFYGYPTFAWVPTHNLNHHVFVNRPGDATITWHHSTKNTWLVASTYFFVSAYRQHPLTRDYVRRARKTDRRLYRTIVTQSCAVGGAHVALLALAMGLRGSGAGVLLYAGTFCASAAMGLWGSIFTNFVQHVHCDPWSAHNHSRNFLSCLENYLLFNNGLHTAHHMRPGVHWSELPVVHAALAPSIHPQLCQSSLLSFCLRTYALGAVCRRYRTQQIGRPPYALTP